MKKILIVIFAFSLSGCALFDAYFMAKYDTNEYFIVNDIKTKAQVAEENCGNHILVVTQVNELYIKALEFKNKTFYDKIKDGLINYKWIALLLIVLINIEWFLRKWYGTI